MVVEKERETEGEDCGKWSEKKRAIWKPKRRT